MRHRNLHAIGQPIFEVLCGNACRHVFWIDVLHVQPVGYVVLRNNLFKLGVAHKIEIGVICMERLGSAVRAPVVNPGEQLKEALNHGASHAEVFGVVVAVRVFFCAR